MSGDFKDIRYMPAFVDKSMLVDTIMQEKYKSVCLIAPRRFGKSVNLTMLKRFWEVLPDKEAMFENRKLFEDTKLEENSPDIINSHCGKYPIILLDFWCSKEKVTSFGDALESLRDVVHEAYKRHSYLQTSDILNASQKKIVEKWCDDDTYLSLADTSLEIGVALKNLAKYLVKHFNQKVIVLVDEYDCVCSNAILNVDDIKEDRELPRGRRRYEASKEIDNIVSLCMGSIGCLLKSNPNVVRGVMTGISYLATMGLSSLNVNTYKFQELHDFTIFYGLTSAECKEVLSRKEVSMESKYEEIIENYNGYRKNMLSIWSVMHYLNDKGERAEKNYWKQSGVVANLSESLRIPVVRTIVTKLLSHLSNEVEIDYLSKIEIEQIIDLKHVLDGTEDLVAENVSVFFSFLLEQGYLRLVDRSNISEGKIIVKIPNLEIQDEFCQKLLNFYSKPDFNLDLNLVKQCASLFDKISTSDKDNEKLLESICNSMNEIINKIKFNIQNEATLHHVIFIILFLCSKFQCFSEIKAGKENHNRLDLLSLCCELGIGIIIELKYDKTAEAGLKQIINNKYFDSFANTNYNTNKSKINYTLFIGLNLSKDKKITLCALFNSKTLKNCVNY